MAINWNLNNAEEQMCSMGGSRKSKPTMNNVEPTQLQANIQAFSLVACAIFLSGRDGIIGM
jgi:hypothetical protein